MASRKMTFTLPDDLAVQFTRRVPARERSHYVAQALAAKLGEREHNLLRACEIANADSDLRAIEQEFDSLSDDLLEPWVDEIAPTSSAR